MKVENRALLRGAYGGYDEGAASVRACLSCETIGVHLRAIEHGSVVSQ